MVWFGPVAWRASLDDGGTVCCSAPTEYTVTTPTGETHRITAVLKYDTNQTSPVPNPADVYAFYQACPRAKLQQLITAAASRSLSVFEWAQERYLSQLTDTLQTRYGIWTDSALPVEMVMATHWAPK
jgi:hypothetical protein